MTPPLPRPEGEEHTMTTPTNPDPIKDELFWAHARKALSPFGFRERFRFLRALGVTKLGLRYWVPYVVFGGFITKEKQRTP